MNLLAGVPHGPHVASGLPTLVFVVLLIAATVGSLKWGREFLLIAAVVITLLFMATGQVTYPDAPKNQILVAYIIVLFVSVGLIFWRKK